MTSFGCRVSSPHGITSVDRQTRARHEVRCIGGQEYRRPRHAIAQVEELRRVRAHREVSGVLPALYRNLTPKGKIRGVPEADGYPTYLRKFECPNGLS